MWFKQAVALLFIGAVSLGVYFFMKAQGTAFCFGAIFAVVVYQFGYYARHGRWIEF